MSNLYPTFKPTVTGNTTGSFAIMLNKEIGPTYVITSEFEKGLYSALDNRNTFQEFMAKMSIVQNKQLMHNSIKKVIFNNPATIVIWVDGSKTVVKCDGEKYDPEKGLAMAICKKLLGNNQGYYYEVFKKWLPKEEPKVEETIYADNMAATVVAPCVAPVLKEEETFDPVKDALYCRAVKDNIYKTYYTPTGEEK